MRVVACLLMAALACVAGGARADARPAWARAGHVATVRDFEAADLDFDDAGRCTGQADFRKAADAAVRSVDAKLHWLRRQRWADSSAVLLVGQSAGGLATVAAGARDLPGVVGYVDFAGGAGGNPERSPGASCDTAQLEALYAGYGRATTVPNLWIYAVNDQFWGASAPRDWHTAFARGGSPSIFVQATAVPDGDGHGLSSHAPALWSPAVDAFLAQFGFPWDAATALRPVLRLDAGGV